MSSPNSSNERVMPMELAIRRELAFRRQIERGQSPQSTAELEFPNPSSPYPPAAMVDSLLYERGLARKRLRDAKRKLACLRTMGAVIPMELALKREMSFRRPKEASEKRALEGCPLMQCSGEIAQSSDCFRERVSPFPSFL